MDLRKFESCINYKNENKHDPTLYSLAEFKPMMNKLGVEEQFSTERIENSNTKFRAKMNINKRLNTAQKQVGVDTTAFLLGKNQYGKLKNIHLNLVRDEIEFRTKDIPDNKIGIRGLTSILRINEKEITSKDLKYFILKHKPVEE